MSKRIKFNGGARTFKQRLEACCQEGNLTVADLARWFKRPYPTIRSWIEDGREPSGGPQDRSNAAELLGRLEDRIKRRQGFPIPHLPQAARIEHLRKIRTAAMP